MSPKFNREYPIRTDVVITPNKFQVYRFRPLSQFSKIVFNIIRLITSYNIILKN